MNVGADWLDDTNSAESRKRFNMQAAKGLVGLNYLTPSGNSAGMEYVFTNVDYTNRLVDLNPASLTDNHYIMHTANALLNWSFLKKTNLDLTIGYSSVQNQHISNFDFSDVTGRATIKWDTTAKTQLGLAGWRAISPSQTTNSNYVLTQGVGFLPTWSATSKLAFKGNLSYETYDYTGSPGVVVGARSPRKDTFLTSQIEGIYEPVRNAEVDLTFTTAKRNSTAPNASYTDYTVFMKAMWKF